MSERYIAQTVSPSNPDWDKTYTTFGYLAWDEQAFDIDPTRPILGEVDATGTDVEIYPSLAEALKDPETVIVAVYDRTDQNRVIGYMWAIPCQKMFPSRDATVNENTAYIYMTVIHPDFRGQKLVQNLHDTLLKELASRGYLYVERDPFIKDGYADKIEKNLGGSTDEGGSIIESHDSDSYGLGMQRHMRIDISRYLDLVANREDASRKRQ